MEGERKLDKKEALISEVLTTNYAYFYRMAYSYVHNEADAQDIVQESAYKAILHSRKLRQTEYVKTWIGRIVINESLTFIRKYKKEELISEETEWIPAAENGKTEETLDLKEAMKRLSPEERSLLALRFFEDKKLDEIAEMNGESLSTVKSRLYRTLKKLKLKLESL